MDKMFNGVMSDSDTISTDETIEMEMSQYVVPYSKWINVKLFDINAINPDKYSSSHLKLILDIFNW